MEKCQIWVETQPSAQPSFQKLNADSNCQKTRNIRYYIWLLLIYPCNTNSKIYKTTFKLIQLVVWRFD